MTLEEFIEYLSNNADSEGIKPFLEKLTSLESKKIDSFLDSMGKINSEDVKKYLESQEGIQIVADYLKGDNGKKLLQPILDSNFTKGLTTWKEKTLPGLIDEEIIKRFPPEDEKDKRLKSLEEKLNQETRERKFESLKNYAFKQATESGINQDLAMMLVTEDADETKARIGNAVQIVKDLEKTLTDKFEKHYSIKLQEEVKKRFGEAGRTPLDGGNPPKGKLTPKTSLEAIELALKERQG